MGRLCDFQYIFTVIYETLSTLISSTGTGSAVVSGGEGARVPRVRVSNRPAILKCTENTVCPRNSDPFHTATYHIKWATLGHLVLCYIVSFQKFALKNFVLVNDYI